MKKYLKRLMFNVNRLLLWAFIDFNNLIIILKIIITTLIPRYNLSNPSESVPNPLDILYIIQLVYLPLNILVIILNTIQIVYYYITFKYTVKSL